MYRGEFDVVLVRTLVLHLKQDLAEGVERQVEDISLVNFVRQHHELILLRELQNLANIALLQGNTSRIPRIDADEGSDVDACILGLVVSLLNALNRGTPVCRLI
jgi:hypothetical protein